MNVEDLKSAIAAAGLTVRGAFHPICSDRVPEVRSGVGARTVILIGNVGSILWQAFTAEQPRHPDPLDGWARAKVEPIANAAAARAVYPGEKPALPFQHWATRAEDVHPSPLGLLIHPEYGLWHAYRAALLVAEQLPLPERALRPSPCLACVDKPCLSACPVGSFQPDGFDGGSCQQHLTTGSGRTCLERGCRARDACPVGRTHRYPDDQVRFHMAAFARLRQTRCGNA